MKQVAGTALNVGERVSSEKISPVAGDDNGRGLFSDTTPLPADAVLIAGDGFGAGHRFAAAAAVLRERGVRGVVAKSFGRRFYREAINSGLALFTADLVEQISDGDPVTFDLRKGTIEAGDRQVQAERYPERLARVVEYGGLVAAVKKELGKE